MTQDFNLFGEPVTHPRYADYEIMRGDRLHGVGAEDVRFGEWLEHRPQSALNLEHGIRAAMHRDEPVMHYGGHLLFAVEFDDQTEDDRRNVLRTFEMDGLPDGWRAAVGEQLLKSKDVDAMAKLRIAAKMAEAKGN